MHDTEMTMSGKICLVTGATSGIGAATARALARMGATVILVGRNRNRCAATVEDIKRATGNPCLECLVADLSVQDEIRRLAQRFRDNFRRLDVLINNAGARFFSRSLSADGFEMSFALNHLGHFILTNLLLKELLTSNHGRIINVSSSSHRSCAGIDFDDLQSERDYDGKKAYAQSKLANLLFTYELSRQLDGTGLTVNAADPGNVLTNFSRNNGWLSWLKHILGSLSSSRLVGPQQGASTSVYLASSPDVEGVTGKYFSCGQLAESSPPSHDRQAAKRLWDVSVELAGFRTAVD